MGKSLVTEDGASQGKRLGLEGGTVFVGLEDGIMLGKRLVAMEAKLLATEDDWKLLGLKSGGLFSLDDGKVLGKSLSCVT